MDMDKYGGMVNGRKGAVLPRKKITRVMTHHDYFEREV